MSIDGLRPDLLLQPDSYKLKIPCLRKLVAMGARAQEVESVFPSTTYPAHATLVTGVPPRIHGIYSHLDSRDPSAAARPWHWFARAFKVPTLWDAARKSGFKTASVGWPVSAGAAIDYNIPEIWDPAASNPYADFTPAILNSTPGLFEEVRSSLDSIPEGATHDTLRTQAALYLWRRYMPDLLLLHLVVYDDSAHQSGPFSRPALQALESTDREAARMWKATKDDAVFVLVSDHGFVPVEHEVAPHVALRGEGLFVSTPKEPFGVRKLGTIHAGGSFAIYWLKKPLAREWQALARAVESIAATGGVASILRRNELRAMGADPDAAMILSAAPGFYFSDRQTGPLVEKAPHAQGTHGHLPTEPGLQACFVATGPGVKAGKNLGRIQITQVAPTLASFMKLPFHGLPAPPLDLS